MKYLSVTQTDEKWGVSTRRIQILCNEERIQGAVKIGCTWAYPRKRRNPETPESKAAGI